MKTLKEDIQKELDTFKGQTFSNSEDSIEWLREAMERIANKTAKALELDQKDDDYAEKLTEENHIMSGKPWDIRYGACASRMFGYNEAVQKQKENKDKYLK